MTEENYRTLFINAMRHAHAIEFKLKRQEDTIAELKEKCRKAQKNGVELRKMLVMSDEEKIEFKEKQAWKNYISQNSSLNKRYISCKKDNGRLVEENLRLIRKNTELDKKLKEYENNIPTERKSSGIRNVCSKLLHGLQ